jgi:phosphoribosylaminoimidazole-succinocarboxamide synthase
MEQMTLEIYSKAQIYALSKGIIIADTKIEFGLDNGGNLTIADELLTPDSSRFWSIHDYKHEGPQKR